MKCEYCDSEVPQGAMQCPLCGAPIRENILPQTKSNNDIANNEDLLLLKKAADAYRDGTDVEQDIYRAIELYESAAKKGCVEAQYELAELNMNANNIDKSIAWFKMAAEAGHILAQYEYALYLNFSNDENSSCWFKKALPRVRELAHNGEVLYQYILNEYYSNAYGDIKNDPEYALKWKNKASEQGEAEYKRLAIVKKIERERAKAEQGKNVVEVIFFIILVIICMLVWTPLFVLY